MKDIIEISSNNLGYSDYCDDITVSADLGYCRTTEHDLCWQPECLPTLCGSARERWRQHHAHNQHF